MILYTSCKSKELQQILQVDVNLLLLKGGIQDNEADSTNLDVSRYSTYDLDRVSYYFFSNFNEIKEFFLRSQ